MLTQILLNPTKSVATLSKYGLYSMFIDECLTRELEKPMRRKTQQDVRRRFMQDLAWWLWCFKRTRTFTVDEIPSELLAFYTSEAADRVGEIRELLVGSVVEEQSVGSLLKEKNAGTFYFPHMSFTEFLVAEYLITRSLKEQDYSVLSASIGGEVKSFIHSYTKEDALNILAEKIAIFLGEHWRVDRGISWDLLALICESPTLNRQAAIIAENPLSFQIDKKGRRGPLRGVPAMKWQLALNLAVLRHAGLHGAILSANLAAVGEVDVDLLAIAMQFATIVLFEDTNLIAHPRGPAMLLGALLSGIRIDKLFTAVRGDRWYNVISDTEDYCVSILTNIVLSPDCKMFILNTETVYGSVFNRSPIVSAPLHKGVKITVDVAEVRKHLRDKHAGQYLDRWIDILKPLKDRFIFAQVPRKPGESAKTASGRSSP
jgi:hypothetical protein